MLAALRANAHKHADGLDGVGRTRKIRRMVWCLAEAARRLDRKWLLKAQCISIMQDGRRGRLLLRYKAATSSLDVRVGILGQERCAGGSAEQVRDATLRILDRSSVAWQGVPDRSRACPEPCRKTGYLVHLFNHIEVFCADSAADEQLAGPRAPAFSECRIRQESLDLSCAHVCLRARVRACMFRCTGMCLQASCQRLVRACACRGVGVGVGVSVGGG